ncbi:MAG TPA: DUF5686 family protein, partial [Flavisolibacter sp.]|nr:DUF5686 family protein [Flavisolibacter sp.]
NQTRPIVLQQEEVKDYQQKDSLELVRKSPAYLDSIDRVRNKVTVSNLLITGLNISRQKSRSSISVPGLAQILSFNTVEGVVVKLNGTYFKRIDTVSISRRSIAVTPEVRYGFSNKHVNSNLSMVYRFGKKYFNSVSVSGGSDVFQFNNAAPVGVLGNTLSTLLYRINNLKIYEAVYGRIGFSKGVGSGLTLQAGLDFQDRVPLENTTDFTLDKGAKDSFTANHPLPQFNRNIERHQAAVFSLGIGWQPGEKYIQYPEQTIAMGSGAPKFFLRYTQAVKGIIGSDVGYSKLLFNVRDDINLKLFGSFNYYLDLGGFLSRDSAAIPDYTHYQGNMSSLLTGSYLDRFQLVPHYLFSNTNSFYSLLYSEHHFNGFLTNKIPGLKQLKWNLVTGTNALYRSSGEYYVEPFVGLENIFKIIRVDYIWGINNGALLGNGFRIGIKTPFNNIR